MSDNQGRHIPCATTANCPKGGTCVTSTVAGVQIKKCCLDESKCKNKAGICPPWTASSTCTGSCTDDGDCPDVNKCCATACSVPGKRCVVPRPWFTYFYF
ncbi:sperm mitochondrial-associated cysteine-rich protein-like [Gigantopelta aegis]|uniref:sperm mitochondrial-associated cysteine-rich protein-like n=1 Tax=Gigantopelta aegis TaxID=1735272 RepID=UPI001B88CC9E|nr:sperm mitochondrial-associated cysteine-rich protein-like [Gigantopelta aegis]